MALLPAALKWLNNETIQVGKEGEPGKIIGYELLTRKQGRWVESK